MIIRRRTTLGAIINLIILLVEIGLWLIINKESFIGVMLILIYVGAIAILFIFVIMMINGPVDSLRDSTVKQLSETRGVSEASSTILLIIISTIGMETLGGMKEIWEGLENGSSRNQWNLSRKGQYNIIDIEDINGVANILMNEYVLHTIEAGMLLLLVMIGVIKMITVGHKNC